MTTKVLKNVELFWVRVDPKNPQAPFGTPQWECQVRTRDKAQSKEWKDMGLNVRVDDDDKGVFYKVGLKRKAVWPKSGDPNKPVAVVDGKLNPLDGNTIGNGSVGNVQVNQREYEFSGKKGLSTDLVAIQVMKLLEYTGGGNGLGFSDEGETDIVSGGDALDAFDDEDDLY